MTDTHDTHPRLTPIPGCEDTHLAAFRQAQARAALEGKNDE